MEKKRGILLMAYGSPERPEDVEPYYIHIRGGRKPSAEEVANLKRRYDVIGGKSPLLRITKSTAEKLERELGDSYKVYAGMKHWHPYISEVFEEISKDDLSYLLTVALAPHYSKMSIGSYQDAVKSANSSHGDKIKVSFVNEWYNNPNFLNAWTRRIRSALSEKFARTDDVFVLFTAHSLPERILAWGDPYKTQLLETADTLAKMSKLVNSRYSFAFQSAGHTSEPWLGPDILTELRNLSDSGHRNILVAPIGFVSDHLEILFDIDVEAKNLSSNMGFHLERTESFNDSQEFIDVLSSVVNFAEENRPKPDFVSR